jgi:negative regulator of replication initiation
MMKRTQIYIDEKTYNYLEKESKAKGTSISEIIRQSIQDKINRKIQKILKSTEEVFGIWKDREFDVDTYIRDSRRNGKIW